MTTIETVKRNDLPEIPTKRYFTIGEVSHLCDVKPHVLRYWEQEFTHLNPNKRRGNRRYYKHKDVLTVRRIRSLLYDQGYTINGARAQLKADKAEGLQDKPELQIEIGHLPVYGAVIAEMIAELEDILLDFV